MRGAVLLSALAFLSAGAEGGRTGASEIARRLFDALPGSLRQLETVVGPLHRDVEGWEGIHEPILRQQGSGPIERIEVRLEFDPFHQDPRHPDPSVDGWELVLRQDCGEILELLQARFGAAAGSYFELERGLLFVDALGRARCEMRWDRRPPDRLRPKRGQEESEGLRSALIRLLSRRISRAAIEEHLGPLAAGASLAAEPTGQCEKLEQPTWSLRSCPAGAKRPELVRLTFSPPLPSNEALAEALGFEDPVAISTDVHMSTRHLVEKERYREPRVQGKRMLVYVADEGLADTGIREPFLASPVWSVEEPRILSIRMASDRRR